MGKRTKQYWRNKVNTDLRKGSIAIDWGSVISVLQTVTIEISKCTSLVALANYLNLDNRLDTIRTIYRLYPVKDYVNTSISTVSLSRHGSLYFKGTTHDRRRLSMRLSNHKPKNPLGDTAYFYTGIEARNWINEKFPQIKSPESLH